MDGRGRQCEYVVKEREIRRENRKKGRMLPLEHLEGKVDNGRQAILRKQLRQL